MRPTSTDSTGTRAAVRSKPGRRLDIGRNAAILDSALEVLAEAGYDAMTVDLVAARAGAARATVYRRWATKAELVAAAVRHLSATDAGSGALPDTGTLRGDLLATIQPQTIEEQRLRIGVMGALMALRGTQPWVAELGIDAGLQPWVAASRALLQRAMDRGEYPRQDVDALAAVLPTMCVYRTAVQRQPVSADFCISLIDGVVLPAMRGADHPKAGTTRSIP